MTTASLTGGSAERDSVNHEFDRVAQIIVGGTTRYQGLTPEETAGLIAILEEKRAEFLGRGVAMPGFGSRFSGRVQTILIADPRARAIFDARMQRRKSLPEGPVRYLGFDTTSEARVFKFGRLPARDDGDLFQIRIAHPFFGPHQLSLQEGPGLCAVILSEKDHASDYTVTSDDVQEFLAKKPSKASKRSERPSEPRV
jgi:hypothetical protein